MAKKNAKATKTISEAERLSAAAPELFKLVLEMADAMVRADDTGEPMTISSNWKLRAIAAIEKARGE